MITVSEGKKIIDKFIYLGGSEVIKIENCRGRILAEDIRAKFDMPIFNNSAMDGFAVRSADLKDASRSKPIKLKIVGTSSAGKISTKKIKTGECMQCMTGAKIPSGADSVVIVEHTSGFTKNNFIEVYCETMNGENIRKKGTEIKKGKILLKKGTKLTPGEVGIAATFGYKKIKVSKKPRVALICTGDELLMPGEKLREGKIYNSNLFVVSELLEESGAQIIKKIVITDEKEKLKNNLFSALKTSDIVITTGGVSMGERDFVREIFLNLKIKKHFWQVAQKPGKPLFFGTKNKTLIFGLPGNPVSSTIIFLEWIYPVIRKILGMKNVLVLDGILKESFPVEKNKVRFLFGKTEIENGKHVCTPTSKLSSNMLSSVIGANSILFSNPCKKNLKRGDKIKFKLFPW